jgi:hypothetical protein
MNDSVYRNEASMKLAQDAQFKRAVSRRISELFELHNKSPFHHKEYAVLLEEAKDRVNDRSNWALIRAEMEIMTATKLLQPLKSAKPIDNKEASSSLAKKEQQPGASEYSKILDDKYEKEKNRAMARLKQASDGTLDAKKWQLYLKIDKYLNEHNLTPAKKHALLSAEETLLGLKNPVDLITSLESGFDSAFISSNTQKFVQKTLELTNQSVNKKAAPLLLDVTEHLFRLKAKGGTPDKARADKIAMLQCIKEVLIESPTHEAAEAAIERIKEKMKAAPLFNDKILKSDTESLVKRAISELTSRTYFSMSDAKKR